MLTCFKPRSILDQNSSFPVGVSAEQVPAQCTLEGWRGRTEDFTDRIQKLEGSYNIRPLLAYDRLGNLILPMNYEKALLGAMVIMEYTVCHLPVELRRNEVENNFFSEIARIRILVPAPRICPSYPVPFTRHDKIVLPSLHDLGVQDR